MASPTARPTMPSADFCTGVRVPRGPLSLVAETRRRPPEVSSIAFTAHPPDLQPQALDGYGLRGKSSARPTWAASYPVSVRQVAALLHASFRPRLAATPLRFANTSPPSGCVGDLHPLAIEHARHTTNRFAGVRGSPARSKVAVCRPCPGARGARRMELTVLTRTRSSASSRRVAIRPAPVAESSSSHGIMVRP
jgi:hypothetical protein